MRQVFLILSLLLVLETGAQAFSYATGGCATGGCAQGEQWLYTNGNEIDDALDALQSADTTHTSDIATLNTALAGYLPLAGGVMDSGSTIDLINAFISVGNSAIIGPSGTGSILATAMSATGQIDDNDLAAGAVDGGTGGEIADGSITTADIADGTVTGTDILNDTVALTTDTSGDYVATITNSDGFITVSGSGTEGRAVTLALAATAATQQELDDKSAASSTTGNIPKFSDTTGDLVDTGVAIDGSNNVDIPGNITVGTSGYTCLFFRDKDDAGDSECTVLNGTMSCRTDAGVIGTCDGP